MKEDRRMQLKADLDTIRKAREHLGQARAILESNLIGAPITEQVREAEQCMSFQLFALTEHLAEEVQMKKIKLSLDYDEHSRGADEEHEYTTTEERDQLITDYIHYNADRISEMAGVSDLSEVEDPEQYVVVSEWND